MLWYMYIFYILFCSNALIFVDFGYNWYFLCLVYSNFCANNNILNRKFRPKIEKYLKEFIDQIAMCCISMDLSSRDLQINGKLFSIFEFVFEFFGRKPKFFPTNSEALILIKLQCVIYQWFYLDKQSFFRISLRNYPRKFRPKTEKYSK